MNVKQVVRYGLAATGLLALVVGPAASASALDFDFSQSTGWELGTAVTGPGFPVTVLASNSGVGFFEPATNPNPLLHPGDNLPPANTYTTIGWGCNLSGTNCTPPGDNNVTLLDPFGNPARSALRATGLAGNVTVDGDWETITHLEHQNNPITGRTLTEVVISSILRIATSGEFQDEETLTINFTETANISPCAGPNPRGSVCDDFFEFIIASFAPVGFQHDGQQYFVEFQLANFVNSEPIFDPTTGTIYTAEAVTSSVDVQMRIVSAPVPEPATLMLLGAGLIGVGIAAAKRRRNKI